MAFGIHLKNNLKKACLWLVSVLKSPFKNKSDKELVKVEKIMQLMKSHGVRTFSYNGLSVEFKQEMESLPLDMFKEEVKEEEKQPLTEEEKKALIEKKTKEETAVLLWSSGSN